MLAPRKFPPEFYQWNRAHGAPWGKAGVQYTSSPPVDREDYFAAQGNNDSRSWEYPWAFHALNTTPGMRVLEIGGGLSGLQFVLSIAGAKVVDVDPGSATAGVPFECDPGTFAKLNEWFGTDVTLVPQRIADASLAEASFDAALSISVIEHLAPEEVTLTLSRIFRALKPGALFVLTWDLFLDCKPFTTREENRFGRNFPLLPALKHVGFELVEGNEEELFGSAAFDHDRVQSNLSQYYVAGGYPTLIQCAVLKRPVSTGTPVKRDPGRSP